MPQVARHDRDMSPIPFFSHGVRKKAAMLLEVNFVNKMDTATIEQIHRLKQLQLKNYNRLPAIHGLTGEQALKTCAFKEFRFEPPFVKRKERKKKKLPPIPEHMLPKRHNSFEEDLDEVINDLPPLPSLSISPAFLTERNDDRSFSVEAPPRLPDSHLFNTREFTFPETSSKRAKLLPSQPSIVPALTPRVRDTPLQAKIEKLAKQKRKERGKRAMEKRYEKKSHNMLEPPTGNNHMAFKTKREPDMANTFQLKEHKQLPFKQMMRPHDDAVNTNTRLHPRLYTRIVDNIYSYTKGVHDSKGGFENLQGPYERLMVTPVTVKEDLKDDYNRQLTVLPPIL